MDVFNLKSTQPPGCTCKTQGYVSQIAAALVSEKRNYLSESRMPFLGASNCSNGYSRDGQNGSEVMLPHR